MSTTTFNRSWIAALAAGILGVAGCAYDDAEVIELVELGVNNASKEYVVEADQSSIEIEVFSNGPFHIERVDETTGWVSLSSEKGNGDQTILAECEFNDEFKRKAGIILCSDKDERRDTIYIKQKGLIEASLSMDNTSVIASGKGGDTDVKVKTNVPFEYMDVTVSYATEDSPEWITGVVINEDPSGGENCSMVFTTDANPDAVAPRTAAVRFSFTDGWGDNVSIQVNLTQRSSTEALGREITLKQFRDDYITGKEVTDYVIVEGIVVSNTPGGNAGENEQSTTSAIDYTGSKKTVYLESLDGSCGLALHTVTEDDNIFGQFDKVKILMAGTTGLMYENPDRYEVKNVTKAMVISQVKGSKADVPVKEKHMAELTDNDIYTYVKLKDVEIPIRKGAICPVNEGYTIATNAHRISKFPLLIRDINGNDMYMFTNTVCLYRNDGTRLPYGSGNISGVIVHERFSRFEWRDGADPMEMEDDPTLGYIGRYQIRHQVKEDVWGEMKDSVEDSFSALLTEYRFWNPDKENMVQRPTYGENGWLDHTYQPKYTGSDEKKYVQATYQQHMWGGGTYEYLGPIGNNASLLFGANFGNKNGIGCVLDLSKEHYNETMKDLVSFNPDGTVEWCGPYATNTNAGYGAGGWPGNDAISTSSPSINYNGSTSMRGKGNVYGSAFCSFASHYWWDDDTQRPYGWLINFSTKGISTSHLSMQISVMNTQQTFYSPRFWKAEWSYQDEQDEAHDKDWHLIKEYTIPDVSVWANTLYSSIVGYKGMNFDLPLEILGHDNVYIRLVPTSDICSDGSDYANARLKDHSSGKAENATHSSNLAYFAIRYNK